MILEALGAIALGAVAGAAVGAVVGVAVEVYKGVKEYQNQDPENKKDLSTFLKEYDYASAGRNVAYGAASGAATVAGAMAVGAVASVVASATVGKAIGAAAGKAIGTAVGGAIGGGVHGYLTSKADVIAAKSENPDKTLNADEKRYIAGETLIGAVTGLAGGVVFGAGSKILNAVGVSAGISSAVTGAVSGATMSATGSALHGKKPELSDTLFSAALGGVVAYGAYKVTDYFVGKNAGTNPEETNAKIRANEDPVKENTGNTSSKNSNQNNKGGSKNSGKNNANTKNSNTAKNNNATKNNTKSNQTSLKENANAAKTEGKTDECPNAGKANIGKKSGKLNWDAIVTKKGETRVDHVKRHAVPNNGRETHGVFNGDPVEMVNEAWEHRYSVEPIPDGMGGMIYNIPYENAGYESGYINTSAQMDYITIVTMEESADLITAFPSFGEYHK